MYEGVPKIFRTDAAKIIKLRIRSIGHPHPRSSFLPHVDTGPTVSSIFGTLPGFLDCRHAAAIQERVTAVLRSIPKETFADSFQKLYKRCQQCVVNNGDYFEDQ
jgi:hypothetical protein